MICIDSDIIIDLSRGRKESGSLLQSYIAEGLTTTVINVYEISINIKNEKERQQVMEILSQVKIMDMTTLSSFIASDIFKNLKADGKEIGQNDTIIAGIMKSHNCNKIMTNNKKHFERINGLEIIS